MNMRTAYLIMFAVGITFGIICFGALKACDAQETKTYLETTDDYEEDYSYSKWKQRGGEEGWVVFFITGPT